MSEQKPRIAAAAFATTAAMTTTLDQKPVAEQEPKVAPRGRCHPELRALDALQLTYPGWQLDKQKAEEAHFGEAGLSSFVSVEKQIQAMREKQAAHDAGRMHPNLVALDTVTWSYPGWQKDKEFAEKSHFYHTGAFESDIMKMRKKQEMHNGNRSHPNLQALDALHLTYPGWQNDRAKAEWTHCEYPLLFASDLERMEHKKQLHDGNRTHANIRALDALQLTYPGWQLDKKRAEKAHIGEGLSSFVKVEVQIEGMRKKQTVYDGGRTHPNLVALDTVKWSYPGWQKDKEFAEESHFYYPNIFGSEIEKMQKKQEMHTGNRTHPHL